MTAAPDHYGPAEDLVGELRRRLSRDGAAAGGKPLELCLMTKWCPQPRRQTRADANAAIARSLQRMGVERLDSLQWHWWDYSLEAEMVECIGHLDALRREGKIGQLALTNFDTARVKLFAEGQPRPPP